MIKTILITGSTDGIGLGAAKRLHEEGHKVLLHGRSASKLEDTKKKFKGEVESFIADLSDKNDVKKLAKEIKEKYSHIDVLINNAGVYKAPNTTTKDGLDVRFTVNTIAPYILIHELLGVLDNLSRVINLSSAAQAPVSLEALSGSQKLSDSEAYAQSKLALTMWTNFLAKSYKDELGVLVSLNPASLLGSKMVKEAYGIAGKDLNIGVDILCRAALSEEFIGASGKYFDNDIGRFSDPHPDALNEKKCESVVQAIKNIIGK